MWLSDSTHIAKHIKFIWNFIIRWDHRCLYVSPCATYHINTQKCCHQLRFVRYAVETLSSSEKKMLCAHLKHRWYSKETLWGLGTSGIDGLPKYPARSVNGIEFNGPIKQPWLHPKKKHRTNTSKKQNTHLQVRQLCQMRFHIRTTQSLQRLSLGLRTLCVIWVLYSVATSSGKSQSRSDQVRRQKRYVSCGD